MVKSTLAKILILLGTLLMIVFLVGLLYVRYDYYTNASPYASAPISAYYLIHGLFFFVPSVLCFGTALILRIKTNQNTDK